MTKNALKQQFLDTDEGKKLLQKADEFIKDNVVSYEDLSENEIRWLVQRLRIYQIELEMQNEELINTQQLLQASKAQYVQFFQHAPVGLAMVTKEGIIEKANNTLSRILNKTTDTILNTPVQNIFDQNSRDVFLGRFKAFYNSPSGKFIECTRTTDNGNEQILLVAGSSLPISLFSEQTAGIENTLILSFQDITEPKRISLQSAQQETRGSSTIFS
jgi:PAS domain S-box-containing protein